MKKLLSIFLVFILALLPFSVFAETDPDSFDMAVVNEIMKNTDIFNLKARSAILIDAKKGNGSCMKKMPTIVFLSPA